MRIGRVGGFCGAALWMLAALLEQASGHSKVTMLTGKEIIEALKGKICTTKGGATFVFGSNGRYAYSGLWKNAGRYSIEDGGVSVAFDSGLERSFTISRRAGLLYMEQTTITCQIEAPKSTS